MKSAGKTIQLDRLVPDTGDGRKQIYRIGDLANEFGVTLRALRFYEDKGLIAPRRQGSTRLYSEQDRSRLKIILLAKQVGFPLAEITQVMEIYDNSEKLDDPPGAMLAKFLEQREILEVQRQEIETAAQRLETAIVSLLEMKQG